MYGVTRNKLLILSCCLVALATISYTGLLKQLDLTYYQHSIVSIRLPLYQPKVYEPKRVAKYLGCFIPNSMQRLYQKKTHKRVESAAECIVYCESTDHMYAYYKARQTMCQCDNEFYTEGLSTLPCGSNNDSSAQVYASANITQIKYKLLNSIWQGCECNCKHSDCVHLSCFLSTYTNSCFVGPKEDLLHKATNVQCTGTSVLRFYNDETNSQFCAKTLNGFLPANCDVWNKRRSRNRLYKISLGSQEDRQERNVTFPLKQSFSQTKVLLLTYLRSGSTFLSEFFKGHPDSYYMFEPLRGVTSKFVYSAHEGNSAHEMAERSTELLNRSFKCEFDLIPSSAVAYTTRKLDEFFAGCYMYAPETRLSCIQAYHSSCLSSDMIVIKTIRARLEWARQLLESGHPELKIVHLIRDPRGLIHSRMGMAKSQYRGDQFKARAKGYCNAVMEDYHTAQYLRNSKYREQVLILRYEDIVIDNVSAAKYIYQSLSIGDLPDSLITHIQDLNDVQQVKPKTFNTKRKSSLETAHKWKLTMSYSMAKDIDDICEETYRLIGYLPINSEQEMRNSSIFHNTEKVPFLT